MEQLVYLSIEKLNPHPDNPRKELGDLTELAESIKANGILQNLTVVPYFSPVQKRVINGLYTVIIGHRRCEAARLAGLTEVPCVIADMTPKEQLSTMLLENMQRSDLTVYEQAQGFQLMMDLGGTVDEIAEKSGFSKKTVQRRLKMAELDPKVLKEVSTRQLSLSDFDKLAQIEDLTERNKALKEIGTTNFNGEIARLLRKQGIQKALPVVKKILDEAKAKALKSSDTWSGKYNSIGQRIYVQEWDGESPLLPERVNGQLYYCLDESYGDLRFYEQSKKPEPVKKSQEEIDRERAIAAAWERVKEIKAVTHKLRSDFVESSTLNTKNVIAILQGAVSSIVFRGVDYSSVDRSVIFKTLGVDDSGYDANRSEKVYKALGQASAKDYPMLVYANFGDGPDLNYFSGPTGRWPQYSPNARLDALYKWLWSLGYEMSDEEAALRDGTHEVFKEKV